MCCAAGPSKARLLPHLRYTGEVWAATYPPGPLSYPEHLAAIHPLPATRTLAEARSELAPRAALGGDDPAVVDDLDSPQRPDAFGGGLHLHRPAGSRQVDGLAHPPPVHG